MDHTPPPPPCQDATFTPTEQPQSDTPSTRRINGVEGEAVVEGDAAVVEGDAAVDGEASAFEHFCSKHKKFLKSADKLQQKLENKPEGTEREGIWTQRAGVWKMGGAGEAIGSTEDEADDESCVGKLNSNV